MNNQWLLTPQFFEKPEPVLADVVPIGATVNGPHAIPDRSAASLRRVHQPIAAFTRETIEAGGRPVSVAGDCCASVPVLAGVHAAGIEPTLVWIDAHADFNTPETSPSQFLGGMPLAMIVGRGLQWMCDSVGLSPIAEERVWLIDGRDLDPTERAAVDGSAIRRTGMAGLATLKLSEPVHLHLDIDVINSNEAPGSNYPVQGGPSVTDAVKACAAFAFSNNIIAISVSGWTGSLDPDGKTKDACAALLDALGAYG